MRSAVWSSVMSDADSASEDNVVQSMPWYTLETAEAEQSKKKESTSPEFPGKGTLGRLIML